MERKVLLGEIFGGLISASSNPEGVFDGGDHDPSGYCDAESGR